MNLKEHPFYETAKNFHYNPERKDGGGFSWRAQALEGPIPLFLPTQDEMGITQGSALQNKFFMPSNVEYLQSMVQWYGFPRPTADSIKSWMRRAFMMNYGVESGMPQFKSVFPSIDQLNKATLQMLTREIDAEKRVNQAYQHLRFNGLYALPDRPVIATRNGRRGEMTFRMPFDDEYDQWKQRNCYQTWEEVPRTMFTSRVNI